jgi:ADP-L-glycero-D-manno-heptose 6-epimerase
MIVVTGSAGFIGSNMVGSLNQSGYKDIILVDDFSNSQKRNNYEDKSYTDKIDRKEFFLWLKKNHRFVQFIFHIGARTDTTESNKAVFDELNFGYSQEVWKLCVEFGLPIIYASSAATYGSGELGYDDKHEIIENLKPLNPYGESKNEFDKWALKQEHKPYFWIGLKFFNVYGPNEYHKGTMSTVIFHSFNQIKDSGKIKLFRSHNPAYKDGEQLRDFIYVKDVSDVMLFLMHHRKNPGIYNLGTGTAHSFLDIARNMFLNMDISENIEFIDTPLKIRDRYQYFTQANMSKLRSIGYSKLFTSLETGINDYVKNYLIPGKYF